MKKLLINSVGLFILLAGFLVEVTKSEDKYISVGGYEVKSTKAKTGAEKAIIENLLEMINEL